MYRIDITFTRHPFNYNGTLYDIVIPLNLTGSVPTNATLKFTYRNNNNLLQATTAYRISQNHQQYFVKLPSSMPVTNNTVTLYISDNGVSSTNDLPGYYWSFANGFNSQFTRTGSGTYFDNQNMPQANNLQKYLTAYPYAVTGWGDDTQVQSHFHPVYKAKGIYRDQTITTSGAGNTMPTYAFVIFGRSTYPSGSDASGHQQFYVATTTTFSTSHTFGVGTRAHNSQNDKQLFIIHNANTQQSGTYLELFDTGADNGFTTFRFIGMLVSTSGSTMYVTPFFGQPTIPSISYYSTQSRTVNSTNINRLGIQAQHERCGIWPFQYTCGDALQATKVQNLQFYVIAAFPTTQISNISVIAQRPVLKIFNGSDVLDIKNTMFVVRKNYYGSQRSYLQVLYNNDTSGQLTYYASGRGSSPIAGLLSSYNTMVTDRQYTSGSIFLLGTLQGAPNPNYIGFTTHSESGQVHILPVQLNVTNQVTGISTDVMQLGIATFTTGSNLYQSPALVFKSGTSVFTSRATHIDHTDNVTKYTDTISIAAHTDSSGHIDTVHSDVQQTTTHADWTDTTPHYDAYYDQQYNNIPHDDQYYTGHADHNDHYNYSVTPYNDKEAGHIDSYNDGYYANWTDVWYGNTHTDIQGYADYSNAAAITSYTNHSNTLPHIDYPHQDHSDTVQVPPYTRPHIDYSYTDSHGDYPYNAQLESEYLLTETGTLQSNTFNVSSNGTTTQLINLGRVIYLDWI